MNLFGDIPDGWQPDGDPTFWMTTNHDFTVVEHGVGWVINDPQGAMVPRRKFKTAGAACRAANDLGFG